MSILNRGGTDCLGDSCTAPGDHWILAAGRKPVSTVRKTWCRYLQWGEGNRGMVPAGKQHLPVTAPLQIQLPADGLDSGLNMCAPVIHMETQVNLLALQPCGKWTSWWKTALSVSASSHNFDFQINKSMFQRCEFMSIQVAKFLSL